MITSGAPLGRAVLTLVLAMPVLAGCGGSGTTGTYTIKGSLQMVSPDMADAGCVSTGFFSDLRKGAEIVVKDLSGKVLTTTALSAAKVSVVECTWTYAARVPKAKFYTVTIPHGGDVTTSFSQLEKDHWALVTTAR